MNTQHGSIPKKWKVAVKATNDVTDYRINVNFNTAKKVYQVFLKEVFIPPTANKLIQNEFNVCEELMENIYTIPFLATVHIKAKDLRRTLLFLHNTCE